MQFRDFFKLNTVPVTFCLWYFAQLFTGVLNKVPTKDNKNTFREKRQLLGFVKMCVFIFRLGKLRWFLKKKQKGTSLSMHIICALMLFIYVYKDQFLVRTCFSKCFHNCAVYICFLSKLINKHDGISINIFF